MSLLIPPAVNYPSPLTQIPSRMQDEPKNGRKQIPAEILWGTMGGPSNCVSFNTQNNATQNFEQITTLKVDNSLCGADVVFIWPDVADTITVPAGTPYALVPVLSNQLQFFVSGPQAKLGDITRFQLLNYQVPPADIPATVESQSSSTGAITIAGGAGGPIILAPATVSGTLETLQLNISNPAAGASQTVVSVADGAGRTLINGWNIGVPAIGFAWLKVIDLNALNWRFTNGLVMSFIAGGGAGAFIANTFSDWHTP